MVSFRKFLLKSAIHIWIADCLANHLAFHVVMAMALSRGRTRLKMPRCNFGPHSPPGNRPGERKTLAA